MAINPLSAAGAYANASKVGTSPGMEARGGGGSFAEMIKDAGRSTAQELRGAEQLSAKAAAKEAELGPELYRQIEKEVLLRTLDLLWREHIRDAIIVTMQVSAPLMVIALVVGVTISLFQALTQIQEMTLVFVPKILAVFAGTLALIPFMLSSMTGLMERIADRIVNQG